MKKALYSVLAIFLSMPIVVSAADLKNPLTGGADTKVLSPVQLVARVVQVLLGISGILALVIIIWAALKIVFGSAQGNDSMIGEGKKALLYAFIGLVVAFLGFIVMNLIITSVTGALKAS